MARRRRRARAVLGALVVLVLAAGAVAVFTLVYHQAKSNDRTNKAQAVERRAAAGAQVSGVVISVNTKGVTIRLPSFGSRRMTYTSTSIVESALTGAASDIKVGRRALVSLTPGQLNVAHEIVVLPLRSPLGTPIANAGRNFMQLHAPGAPIGSLLGTGRAKIRNAVVAPRSAVKVGMNVLARVRRPASTSPTFIATEIVLLPGDSVFG
jgi:hypothetical protein